MGLREREKATLGAFSTSLDALLADTLAKASDLSAVERFSQWHQTATAPAHQGLYRELMPATAPGPGQQYSFEVDLDKCSGCKACVVACHTLNGLDEQESWRTTGTLVGEKANATITTSCHHCVDPGCANGCPTLAYEKDVLTGIVRHLDDQCMGCQYCLWTCPYDAPKWNAERGIVRKCDLCHDRLAVGEAPACVQSCPSQAIRVVIVDQEALRADPSRGTVLPGIVPPQRTQPTTVYKGELAAGVVFGDAQDLRPEHAHGPLALLLVLTQWAAGLWILEMMRRGVGWTENVAAFPVASGLLLAGLVIGSFHLGRPLKAWKAFLGWRKSWFSREVLTMGNAVPFALAASLPSGILPESVRLACMAMASLFLVAGVGCSAMLYIATPRVVWARPATAWRFALTALGGGAVVLGAFGVEGIRWMGVVSILTGLVKSRLVLRDRKPAVGAPEAFLRQAKLLRGPLGKWAKGQFHLFLAAVGMAVMGTVLAAWPFFVAAVALRLGSDLVERRLFFQACPPTRMPGAM
jgi:Fe-S-cluster-containing dehydrogenase component/DMSO reductase anchor subunit